MTSIRVQPDVGPPVDFLSGGSQITDEERPEVILPVVIAKLRQINRATPAREVSLAITHAEESLHWLVALSARVANRSTGG
jgi:hypothetical protein